MPQLSWNEIRQRAIQFSREWSENPQEKSVGGDERAEAQTFWNELFYVFGLTRRHVATFEERVQSTKGTWHRIDLFWKNKLLAEHKSRGEDLSKATTQAFNYIQELINEDRQDECPRYVIVSDFNSIILYDLEPDEKADADRADTSSFTTVEIPIKEFHKHIKHFAFMTGRQTQRLREQDPANLKAAKLMARLHDTLEQGGYEQPDLERMLVRILFCLFADDTGVFDPDTFDLYIENRTKPDGSDLGHHLQALFEVLDTPEEKRKHIHDDELLAFPYINGELYLDRLHFAYFNSDMRNALLAACRFDWSRISPAIFGSLFQGVMDSKERRQIGAHYTSERDILKLIEPLFMDALRKEFTHIKKLTTQRKSRLLAFQNKLAGLKFLDPACGCGNFLVIAYRELRELELELLLDYYDDQEVQQLTATEVQLLSKVDVDQFYGIEIDMWPSRIAETALWLTDHQMNMRLSEAFGQEFKRIPLKKSPHIQCANALRMDWNDLLPAKDCSYVLGNPPFIGGKYQDAEQKKDVKTIAGKIKSHGLLDYVCMWYFKAADYIQDTDIQCAFVSTNSITQGEQVGVLWPELFSQKVRINFAHRTFSWQSEASGAAHVHVVILGFALVDKESKTIFEYEDIKGKAKPTIAETINPYLIDANPFVLVQRCKNLCDVPAMSFGNQPIDGGYLLLTDKEKIEILKEHPELDSVIRRYVGAQEFIHGVMRWCLWLTDADLPKLRSNPLVYERLKKVKEFRLASKRPATQELAKTPSQFAFISHKDTPYLLVPSVSSERRIYIPIGFMQTKVIASNLCLIIPAATPFHFGVLTSTMHMAWVRQVCGRLKSDFRYSAKLVYNNYPWPQKTTKAQEAKVAETAQTILEVRKKYLDKGSTLADLYDPLTMPSDLLKAHQANDRAVDKCYRGQKFDTERERVEYLFALYEELTAPLSAAMATKKKSRRKRS